MSTDDLHLKIQHSIVDCEQGGDDIYDDDNGGGEENEDDTFDMDAIPLPRLSSSTLPIVVRVSNAHRTDRFYQNADDPLFQGKCLYISSTTQTTTKQDKQNGSTESTVNKPINSKANSLLTVWDQWSLSSLFQSALQSLILRPLPRITNQNNNNNNNDTSVFTVPSHESSSPRSKLQQLLFLVVTIMGVKRTESASWLPRRRRHQRQQIRNVGRNPFRSSAFSPINHAKVPWETFHSPPRWSGIESPRGGGGAVTDSTGTSPVVVAVVMSDGDQENDGRSFTASILMVPPGVSLESTTTNWNLSSTNDDTVLESIALLCDILIVLDNKFISDKYESRLFVSQMRSFPMDAIAKGVQRRLNAGLGTGRLIIVSPQATDKTWIQQQVLSEPFSIISPQQWDMFDFHTRESLSDIVPSDYLVTGSTVMERLFEMDDHDKLVKLFPSLMRHVIMTLDSSVSELSLEETSGSILAVWMSNLTSVEAPATGTMLGDGSPNTETPSLKDDTNIIIEQVLVTAHEQLGVLESKMEEVALQQSEGYAMPLLEFGSLAQKIMTSTESQLQSMEDSGEVSPSLRRGLTRGIRKQLRRLYKDQLQALRNYYGQRYESILEKTKFEDGANVVEVEREWVTSAEHMTQGFRAAAQSAIPAMFRNKDDEKDFEYTEALQGLIKDMLESTERRKDEQSLSEMALADEEGGEDGVGNKKRWGIKIPKWLERVAARAFVFGVNYLQGWLAWQAVRRAALERDRLMPKFPLF
ncbi:hypothetical protein IV203_029383 [Nitzschia inconspicua]|uniref:Uncharacterized protein n=1 Tax=Nitzschia inconspicua TaxID=303405 RepID=A0A9K3LQM1_9STRA|nr:hypothetical protein IV203_029383 [Nitzschia inconspicua]